MSAPRPEPELVGLVYSLTPKPVEVDKAWYQRPTVWALAVLALAVVLNIIFA
jgi:SSS family solute:Na+ symporter